MRKMLFERLTVRLAAASLLLALGLPARAQGGGQSAAAPEKAKPATAQAKTDEKAEAVLKRAVEALGGGAYMGVKTMVSRGYYTPFRDGVSGPPIRFEDYLVFPDRERTEFRGSGIRSVQTNTGETGWLFEGQSRKISDATPEQVESFRRSVRTSVDNLLRGWWRSEGASLTYVGRREAGLAKRNEVVRVAYPDGFSAEFEFDARDGLPNKVRYKRENKEGETVEEEYRFAQYLTVGSLRQPFIVDQYTAGVQSSRVNYEQIEFNLPVPDSLFAKPSDVKAFLKTLK